jgi:hypothetical protein
MSFYANRATLEVLKRIVKKAAIEAEFNVLRNWDDARTAALEVSEDEGLIMLVAKRGMVSYLPQMRDIPDFLNQNLSANNYLLIYPFSEQEADTMEKRSVSNHRDFAEIGKIISRIFK